MVWRPEPAPVQPDRVRRWWCRWPGCALHGIGYPAADPQAALIEHATTHHPSNYEKETTR